MSKRKIIKVILCFVFAVWIVGHQDGMPDKVMAADQSALLFENLEINDLVEVYRIASFAENTGKANWTTAVSNWIENTTEGNAYRTLTPERLSQMTEERAEEFCSFLLIGLKNDAEGIANIPGYTFTVDEEKEQYALDTAPGYYVVLPKGTQRVYALKWVIVESGQEVTVAYSQEEGDFQIPQVSMELSNLTANRGADNDTEEYPLAWNGDELEITAHVEIPKYPHMYSSGKRILNLCVVVPRGLTYSEDTLTMKDNMADLTEESYSLQQLDNSIGYETQDGRLLFIGTLNGYFYLIDGSLLLAAGTEQEALDKYNSTFGTEYLLKDIEKDEDSSSSEEAPIDAGSIEGVSAENSQPESDTVKPELLNADSELLYLSRVSRMTVFIIALDTETEISELNLSYKTTKDKWSTDTGFFPNRVLLGYSTSPLDSNLNHVTEGVLTVASYGIRITVCMGDGNSVGMTAEEILETSPRMKDANFYLYRLNRTYDGNVSSGDASSLPADTNEAEEDSGTLEPNSGEDDQPSRWIYDRKVDKTYEYSFVQQLDVDGTGVTEISGVNPGDYMIVQNKYPEGYTRSQDAILIRAEDWQDAGVMEGKYLMDFLWLDYATVYLPGTGKTGILIFVLLGTLLSAGAIVVIVKRMYPHGIKDTYLIIYYLLKRKIRKVKENIVEKIRNL